MSFIPVPNTVEAVLTYRNSVNQNVAKNVYNFHKQTGLVQPADLIALRDALVTWENDNADSSRSNQVSLTHVYLRELTTESGFVLDYTLPIPVVGTIANPVMPMNVSYAVKHTTGLAGRSFRGRSYWIGLSEADVAGDFVTQARSAAIVTAYDELRTDILAATGFEFVVVSRYADGLPRVTGVFTPIVDSSVVDLRVDTQRRRLVGEGE